MIKKQNLWFLTLFSLVLVLSVYYITMPNELFMVNENKDNTSLNDNKKVSAEIKESELIVTMRVNLEEVKLTTAHIQEFINHVENIEAIKVLEDSSVEKGGCIVETDFGAIDARISSQLTELENKILEVSPLKTIKPQDNLTSAE